MQLSQSLRVRSYPYTALLAFSGSRTRLITAAEGLFNTTELLPLLQQAQDSQSASLVAEQIERTEQVLRRHCCLDCIGQSWVFWACSATVIPSFARFFHHPDQDETAELHPSIVE